MTEFTRTGRFWWRWSIPVPFDGYCEDAKLLFHTKLGAKLWMKVHVVEKV